MITLVRLLLKFDKLTFGNLYHNYRGQRQLFLICAKVLKDTGHNSQTALPTDVGKRSIIREVARGADLLKVRIGKKIEFC